MSVRFISLIQRQRDNARSINPYTHLFQRGPRSDGSSAMTVMVSVFLWGGESNRHFAYRLSSKELRYWWRVLFQIAEVVTKGYEVKRPWNVSCFIKTISQHTSPWLLCVTVALKWMSTLRIFLIWLSLVLQNEISLVCEPVLLWWIRRMCCYFFYQQNEQSDANLRVEINACICLVCHFTWPTKKKKEKKKDEFFSLFSHFFSNLPECFAPTTKPSTFSHFISSVPLFKLVNLYMGFRIWE